MGGPEGLGQGLDRSPVATGGRFLYQHLPRCAGIKKRKWTRGTSASLHVSTVLPTSEVGPHSELRAYAYSDLLALTGETARELMRLVGGPPSRRGPWEGLNPLDRYPAGKVLRVPGRCPAPQRQRCGKTFRRTGVDLHFLVLLCFIEIVVAAILLLLA